MLTSNPLAWGAGGTCGGQVYFWEPSHDVLGHANAPLVPGAYSQISQAEKLPDTLSSGILRFSVRSGSGSEDLGMQLMRHFVQQARPEYPKLKPRNRPKSERQFQSVYTLYLDCPSRNPKGTLLGT